MAKNILIENLSEPLNGATSVKVDIDAGIGHLTIDRLTGDEQMLATGTLQYLEDQEVPTRSLNIQNGQVTLTFKGTSGRRSWLRLPWDACGGAYEWLVHLNPKVQSDIIAHTGGGNVKLDLAGMAVTQVTADTGGGNIEVFLPDNAASLTAVARTGGGNVTVEVGNGVTGSNTINAGSGAGNIAVHLPSGIAARIHATSGLGKIIVDPRFTKIDEDTYQSPDYDSAANKIEITAKSGAGNVIVDTTQRVEDRETYPTLLQTGAR